jgi:molybdopterin-binding protein
MPIGLTRPAVRRLLGVSEKSLYAWEKAGRIPRPARDHRGWRSYSPQDVDAIRRVLGPAISVAASSPAGSALAPGAGEESAPLALTARNQINGVVAAIHCDGLMAEVTLRLADGQEIVSVVTSSSVRRLGLTVGTHAAAIIKATEVMLHR